MNKVEWLAIFSKVPLVPVVDLTLVSSRRNKVRI